MDLVSEALGQALAATESLDGGEVADYIPELAEADRHRQALALVSVAGHDYAVGDADHEFTLQSVSKPFVYALAVDELGIDVVERSVGSEPSGEAFNAISLDPATGRPVNAMINAGAIMTTSLIEGSDTGERLERLLATLSAFAGRDLHIDEQVYASELETGDRNRALAYLMRSTNALRDNVDDVVNTYFRQCAVLVNAHDLAVMAATLANRGINPVTGTTVVGEAAARCTLAQMASAGMYDQAGAWLLKVGMPAKSGVSGGIAAVDPGQFGVGVFSPALDEHGTSVRGGAILRTLSEEYGLHLLAHAPSTGRRDLEVTVRRDSTVLLLPPEIDFAVAEQLSHLAGRLIEQDLTAPTSVIIDLAQVSTVRRSGARLLRATVDQLQLAMGSSLQIHDPTAVLH